MRTLIITVWTVVVLLLGRSPVVIAQEVVLTSGQLEYQSYCASCHGRDGKGKGAMADLLRAVPADLTQLNKKHGGQFPFWRIYGTIDGREEVMAHGSRTMPVWGAHFLTEAGGQPLDEQRVIGRILALVYYLESIQVK
jgi:mono/diheme cytochrome c family protein